MADIISVSNAEELMNALASAKGGDTIELAGGDYGDLSLIDGKTDFNVRYDAEVTLRSADADQPASFSGMNLSGVSNLTFDGLVFDYEFAVDDPIYIKPFSVSNGSDHIKIRNSVFDGDFASGVSDKADGFGNGTGLSIRGASDILIDNNEFSNWHRGATFARSENLSVTGNDVYAIRSDGFNFIEVKSVLIEKNYIHDFSAPEGSSDHRDMIQFWTKNTDTPSVDVIIRDNILDIGDGAWTQSIFMRNEEVDLGRAGVEMHYQNILIENNTIYNGHLHGITVGETDGLTIRNNSILQAQGGLNDLSGGVSIPKISVKTESTSVVIQNNITSAINGFEQQSDWTVSDNVIIEPEGYLENFIISTTGSDSGAHNFIALPDSIIEQLGAGSDETQFSEAPDTLAPLFQMYEDEAAEHTLICDASLTVGPLGLVSQSDAKFLWSFEDGSTATGQIVKHDFGAAGYHGVTLSVISQDGTAQQAQFTAGIKGNDIVQFDARSGQFEALAYGEKRSLETGDISFLKSAEDRALKLGGEGSQASIASSELSSFFGADAFELSMSLRADGTASWGEIARIHTSLTAGVDRDGNFEVELFLDDGSRAKIASQGVSLNDGDVHDVTVLFDGDAGFATIMIDGRLAASESVSGSLGGGARSLDFGNPWGKQNFDGELSAFALSADTGTFATYKGSTEMISNSSIDVPQAIMPELDTIVPEPDAASDSEVQSEDDASVTSPLLRGGYKMDIAAISDGDTVSLHYDAHIVETQDGQALSFDGQEDYVRVGRLAEFEQSQKIAFSIDFTNDSTDGSAERLVWNHTKFGLTLEGDGIRVHAANNDDPIWKGFQIKGLGLNDGNQHSATVMVDAETDRLQVVVDDVLVLDEQNTDFDFVGGREAGWSLGTAWNRWFEGEVYDFQVSDNFSFIEPASEDGAILV